MPNVSRRRILLPLPVLALIFVAAFQNCSQTQSARPADRGNYDRYMQGGEGYGGKLFVNHGACGADDVQLKSVLRKTGTGAWEIVRENCADLPAPIPVAGAELRPALHDPSVLLHTGEVFDLVPESTADRKLTTAFCYDSTNQMELEVWYVGATLDKYPDPRLAKELFAQVKFGGSATEIFAVSPPQIFTDKLVYAGSGAFELSETRNGTGSSARFSYQGREVRASLTCHAQAAPKFLETDMGYFLDAGPQSPGGRYALITHDAKSGTDIVKRIDESAPVSAPNSNVGWDAGYLTWNGRVLQMRKQPSGKICFAPSESPDAPCSVEVLGKVSSEDYADLNSGYLAYSKTYPRTLRELVRAMQARDLSAFDAATLSQYRSQCSDYEPYPRHLHWNALSVRMQVAAETLLYITDPKIHADVRTEVVAAARALIADLPDDPFATPLKKCKGHDLSVPSRIFAALNSAHAATGEAFMTKYISSKNAYFKRELGTAKKEGLKWNLTGLASYMRTVLATAAHDPVLIDDPSTKELFKHMLGAQALSPEEAACGDSTLKFGEWRPIPGRAECKTGPAFASAAAQAAAGMFYHLKSRGSCADGSEAALCARASAAVLGHLAALFNSQTERGGLDDSEGVTQYPRLLAFAFDQGVADDGSIQGDFSEAVRIRVALIRKAALDDNKRFYGRAHPTIMANLMVASRLAELAR